MNNYWLNKKKQAEQLGEIDDQKYFANKEVGLKCPLTGMVHWRLATEKNMKSMYVVAVRRTFPLYE